MKTQVIAVLVGSGLALAASSSLLATGARDDRPVEAPATRASSPAPVATTPRGIGRQAVQTAAKRPAHSPIEEAPAPAVPLLSLSPDRALKGDEGVLQGRLISHLNRTGFVPESREADSRWVYDLGGKIIGWRVESTEVTRWDAGDLITLWIYPIQTTGATVVNGGVFETYRLTDDGATFLSSRVHPAPRVTTF